MPLVLAALLLPSLAPGDARAHAGFEASEPAPNAVLERSPDQVTIRFTEPLERSYSTAELYDQDGELVPGTAVGEGSDEFEMVLSLPPGLANGTYSVLWRTLSTADGHTARNYFAFTVGTEADVAAVDGAALEEGGTGPPLWLQALSRWTALLGLAAVVAAWPVWLFVIRPSLEPVGTERASFVSRLRTYTVIAIAVAFAGDLLALAVQAAAMTGGSLVERAWDTVQETRYGDFWWLRVALLAGLALILHLVDWLHPRRRLFLSVIALILSIAAVVPYSYVAHASAQARGRSTALFYDAIHVFAASLWVGGLFAICFVVLPQILRMVAHDRRRVLSESLPRFSAMSLVAWTALALTGTYSAWLHVGGIDALLDTGYGNALLIKLALLVPILLLAAFNLLMVTPRLRHDANVPASASAWTRRFTWAVAAEAVLAIAVLLAVGSLTARPPARETLATPASSSREVALTGGEEEATLTLTPGTPGPNFFEVTLGGVPLPHETAVLLRVASREQDTGEKDLALEHGGGATYTWRGNDLSIAGGWDFQLIVRPPTAAEWRAFGSAELGATGSQEHQTTAHWILSSPGGAIGMSILLLGAGSLFSGWQLAGPAWRRRLWIAGATLIAIGSALLAVART